MNEYWVLDFSSHLIEEGGYGKAALMWGGKVK